MCVQRKQITEHACKITVMLQQTVPCLATIKLAIQSGTLVPAARKVMPMITSGIPRVYPITVT